MTTVQFQETLRTNLQSLSTDRTVDFAINICKRLLPDYKVFHEKHQWGDFNLLKEVLERVETRTLEPDNLNELMEKVDAVVPDTEDFGDFDGSYALNASAAVYELLNYLKDKQPAHLFYISSSMIDTIDFKLSERDPSLSDEALVNHPELLKEMNLQLALTKG